MKTTCLFAVLVGLFVAGDVHADEAALPKASIDGNGPGWRALGEQDFVNVNCQPDTWSFKDGKIQCTGTPTGVMRMKEPIRNFDSSRAPTNTPELPPGFWCL